MPEPEKELYGEKIYCEGRKIQRPGGSDKPFARGGAHRGDRVVVKGDPAWCTALIPWRWKTKPS